MWASHVVHHTPEQIHLASALRIGVTQLLSATGLFRLPLHLLGFNPIAVVGPFGPLEWVFNTPLNGQVRTVGFLTDFGKLYYVRFSTGLSRR